MTFCDETKSIVPIMLCIVILRQNLIKVSNNQLPNSQISVPLPTLAMISIGATSGLVCVNGLVSNMPNADAKKKEL